MKRLSPTLLDSFSYYLSLEETERSTAARKELLARLKGEKAEPSDAIIAGLKFEDDVIKAAASQFKPTKDERYNNCVDFVAKKVKGGIYQYEITFEIGGVLFEGCADIVKRNRVIDIKTTRKYTIGKYQSCCQHLVYLSALKDEEINKFQYLVTDFRNIYKEDYSYLPAFPKILLGKMNEFFGYLELDEEMKEAYELYAGREAGYKEKGKQVNILI